MEKENIFSYNINIELTKLRKEIGINEEKNYMFINSDYTFSV